MSSSLQLYIGVVMTLYLSACGGGGGSGSGSGTTNINLIAFPLNDTGITKCADYAYDTSGTEDNNLDCPNGISTGTQPVEGDPIPGGQDGQHGRDALARSGTLGSKVGGGHAGFDFTKLTSAGITTEGSMWSCVHDNVTGLTWEVKDLSGLRDKDNTYTWYNSSGIDDGGSAGTSSGGACSASGRCDTEKYVADVNAINLCGFNDWRLPQAEELISIASFDRIDPAIDTNYFPNTVSASYWTASPYIISNAWYISFSSGNAGSTGKFISNRVRLVR